MQDASWFHLLSSMSPLSYCDDRIYSDIARFSCTIPIPVMYNGYFPSCYKFPLSRSSGFTIVELWSGTILAGVHFLFFSACYGYPQLYYSMIPLFDNAGLLMASGICIRATGSLPLRIWLHMSIELIDQILAFTGLRCS